MIEFQLRGLGVAAVTPFNEDKSIDFNALGNLLDYLINGNVDYIVVLGTTAETSTLSPYERREVMDFAVKHVNGRVPLVLGFGGNNTQALVDELKSVPPQGFSAILSVVPYYNKPTQEGIFQHYKAIADVSPVPIILYNVPGRTGVNMTAETTLRLANEVKNILGVKEASGNIDQIIEVIKKRPHGFKVISGDDGLTLSLVSQGADGVISVIGNAFPKKFSQLVSSCLASDFENAKLLHEEFSELFKLLFVEGNPAGIKCALEAVGIVKNTLRLPLVPVSESTNTAIKQLTSKILD